MTNVFKSLCAGSVLSLSIFTLSFHTQAETGVPKAVEKIDVNQYAGQWYEIAHLPMFFQRKCVSDTTAQYTVNSDQTIGVLNSCRTETNEMISSKGLAYAQNAGNSRLKVSFLPSGLRWLPFTKGDYWVLRVDPNYKVALVGGSSHKYLWILSRDSKLDQATYQSYLQTAREYGYDVSKLVQTPHQP